MAVPGVARQTQPEVLRDKMGNTLKAAIQDPTNSKKLAKAFKKADQDGNGQLDHNEWKAFSLISRKS